MKTRFAIGAVWAAVAAMAAPALAYEDLPLCGDVFGGQDCRIELTDGDLVFGYGADDTLMISQADPRGAWIAKIPPFETMTGPVGPTAMDLTGDGTDEVLVPTAFGNVNVAYVVLGRDDLGRFATLGEILGGMPEGFETRDGLIIGHARANAATYVETAWSLADGALTPVYDLSMDLSRPEGTRCDLTQGPAWSTQTLSPDPILQACEAAALTEGES